MRNRGIWIGVVLMTLWATGCAAPHGTGILVALTGSLESFDALDVTARIDGEAETKRITDGTQVLRLPTSFVVELPARSMTVQLTVTAKLHEALVAVAQTELITIGEGEVVTLALSLDGSAPPVGIDAGPADATDGGTTPAMDLSSTDGPARPDSGASDMAQADMAPPVGTWQAVNLSTAARFGAVWAPSAASAFIGGDNVVYILNDGAWTYGTLALGTVNAIAGTHSGDVYAVGSALSTGSPVQHYNGAFWSAVTGNNCTQSSQTWLSAMMDDSGRLLMAGFRWTGFNYSRSYCVVYNGNWSAYESGGSNTFDSVAVLNGTIYLADQSSALTVVAPQADSPPGATGINNFVASRLWGQGTTTLLAGGRNLQSNYAMIASYSPSLGWSAEVFAGINASVSGLSGVSATNVYATVGTHVMHRVNGWQDETPLGNTRQLTAVHARASNDVWVVGELGTVYRFH